MNDSQANFRTEKIGRGRKRLYDRRETTEGEGKLLVFFLLLFFCVHVYVCGRSLPMGCIMYEGESRLESLANVRLMSVAGHMVLRTVCYSGRTCVNSKQNTYFLSLCECWKV